MVRDSALFHFQDFQGKLNDVEHQYVLSHPEGVSPIRDEKCVKFYSVWQLFYTCHACFASRELKKVVLPEKCIVARNSILTVLGKDKHVKAVYYLLIAVLLGFAVDSAVSLALGKKS